MMSGTLTRGRAGPRRPLRAYVFPNGDTQTQIFLQSAQVTTQLPLFPRVFHAVSAILENYQPTWILWCIKKVGAIIVCASLPGEQLQYPQIHPHRSSRHMTEKTGRI